MNSIERPTAARAGLTPRWVTWTLLVGTVVLLGWAWVIHGFLSEPSATGRVRILLLTWAGFSVVAALLGITAAFGAMRAARWSRVASSIAGAAMTLSVIGAITGVPALLGMFWSRHSLK